MKEFDKNYKLLDEMYQDDYYPAFLVVSETLRCGTTHFIIQVVRFVHDKQISGGVNQPVLTAPELHEMLG